MRATRWCRALFPILLGASAPLGAQQAAPPVPHSTRRSGPATPFAAESMFAETLAGAFVGVIASRGCAWIGAAALGPHGGEDPGLAGALTGFMVGAAAGTALGVHLAARGFGFPASYWEALAGGVAGTLALGALPLDADRPTFWVLVYGAPALGAMLASSIGSASRIHPVMRAANRGIDVGVAVTF